jgi:hypothetical protein
LTLLPIFVSWLKPASKPTNPSRLGSTCSWTLEEMFGEREGATDATVVRLRSGEGSSATSRVSGRQVRSSTRPGIGAHPLIERFAFYSPQPYLYLWGLGQMTVIFEWDQNNAQANPNFTRSAAKLLIFLYAATFCSHNTSSIFILTSTWVSELCESTETKSTVKHSDTASEDCSQCSIG